MRICNIISSFIEFNTSRKIYKANFDFILVPPPMKYEGKFKEYKNILKYTT